jgi:hypothetical protein
MATSRCPRCDRPLRSARSIHMACALYRARVWVGVFSALLIVALAAVTIWAVYGGYFGHS